MTRQARRQAGFSLMELIISVAVLMTLLAVMSGLLTSTDALAKTSHVRTRAVAEHRRNLESLSSVLRTADIRSLAGFDAQGQTAAPTFQRVTGVDAVDLTLSDPEQILWRANPQPVNGVANPGALWLVSDAGARMVADRVPSGAFQLRQEGGILAIRLTTYYAVDAQRVTTVTSETAVTVRN